MNKRTFCNPVNINYRYQPGYFGRESADPLVVLYHGVYFLFASHGEGYWTSGDLVNWDFIKVDIKKFPDFELFAPGTCVVGDRLYTDIATGVRFGMPTVLVLSGETKKEQLENSTVQPDLVLGGVDELLEGLSR